MHTYRAKNNVVTSSSRDDKATFYEGFAEQWDAHMDLDELGKRLRLVFGGLLSRDEVAGKRVLDAGGGTGHFSRRLCEWGGKVTVVDVGEKLLEEVRKKAPVETVCGSVLELPFDEGRFDVVFCTEVIEHTTDPARAVAELCRVAAPGGIMVLTVPNRVWKPAVWVANAFKLRPYGGYENWVGDRPLRRWIDAAGLSVETQLGFNLLPHTRFCRPAFDGIDRLSSLHPG